MLARALVNEDLGFAATRWSDALSSQRAPRAWGGVKFGSRRVDSRAAWVDCTPEEAFRPIAQIGGDAGWYYGNRLWRLRGLLDIAVGGPGLRRGRRDPESVIGGRCAGLLAGGGNRARPLAAARRRDAASGPGLASVRGHAGERRKPDPPDGALRPRRGGWAAVLVWPLGNPPAGVCRNAAQHRRRRSRLPDSSDAKDSSRRRSAA